MSMLARQMAGGGVAATKTYVDDVFGTYLYTGNASLQTVKNGLALTSTAAWSVGKMQSLSPSSSTGVAVDASGNLYACHQDQGGYGYITKHNAAGVMQWQRKLSGAYFNGIAVDASGNVYAVAYSVDSVTYINTVKYNASGVFQWERRLTEGTGVYNTGRGIAVDDSSNVYVTGSCSTDTLNYIILAKYNTSGTLQWQKKYSRLGGIFGRGICLDAIGNLYVVGSGYVLKCDTSGNLQSQIRLQLNYDSAGVAADASNNVYVVGSSASSAAIIIIKYNSSGAIQWQRQLSSVGVNGGLGYGVAVDAAGGVYVSGSYGNNSIAAVAKYNASGAIQWWRSLADVIEINKNFGYGIAADTNGNVFISGSATNGVKSYQVIIKLPQDGGAVSGSVDGLQMTAGSVTESALSIINSSFPVTESTSTATASTGTGVDALGDLTYTYNSQAAVASDGGMVWLKNRSGSASDHALYDTVRGAAQDLASTTSAAATTQSTGLTSFNANGFSLGALAKLNSNAVTYASWTFRKALKFFDVVTYTGTGANRSVSHALGVAPGMILIKRTDTTGSWMVYHNGIANTENLVLNATSIKATDATAWGGTTATSTTFSLGTNINVNAGAGTYVAYLFAHDASADGLIQCGGYTGNGTTQTLNFGWEPQFFLVKRTNSANNWQLVDFMRGMPNGSNCVLLQANLSGSENSGYAIYPTATGLNLVGADADINTNTWTYIYVAIRRPNKPPTTGTSVFMPAARTGTGAAVATTAAGFAPDLVITKKRSSATLTGARFTDRLRGKTNWLDSSATTAETSTVNTVTGFDNMLGFTLGADTITSAFNTSAHTYIDLYFKRAPGVFDQVCYTATGNLSRTVEHSLGVIPEFIIAKCRDISYDWFGFVNGNRGLSFNLNAIKSDSIANPHTATTFATRHVQTALSPKDADGFSDATLVGKRFVAYLFATSPGVSKVFGYTGNGSSQTINCGFTAGARFVLIKRTDSNGDWFIWDTARGIIAANDPHLSLNTTAAEVTTDDSIDPDNTGFIVNQLAATNINVTSATYIGLAIA